MKKLSLLFLMMGILYVFIEVCFSALLGMISDLYKVSYFSFLGQSSLWMLIVGGFMGVTLGFLNEVKIIRDNINYFWSSIIGMILIFIIEFCSGIVLNIILKFDIWSYSHLPFNLLGQITLCYAPLWFLICPLAFWTDDMLRYNFYDEGTLYSIIDSYKKSFNPSLKP